MKKGFCIVGAALLLFAQGYVSASIDDSTPPSSQPASGGRGWELIWSDEFNGQELDSSKWSRQVSTKSRNPRWDKGIHDWWWKADNAFLDGNGKLILRAEKHDWNTLYCGSINTNNIYEPQYGYFEVRMKAADTSKAVHTAFWFQGDNMGDIDGSGADGAEIDVFESAWVGDFTKSVVHIDGYGSNKQANTKRWNAPGIHSGFHTYGLEWTEDYLKIYYDGQLKTQYTNAKWIPQVGEYIWLSDGASFGDGDFQSQQNGFLTDAEVEYVRVWQKDTSGEQITNDSGQAVQYSEGWGSWSGNPGYQNDSHYCNTPWKWAEFTFTGTKAVYYGFKRNDLGIARIYLDSILQTTVDCYSSQPEYFVPLYETPWLPYGTHTLMVRVINEKNPASSGNEIIIDAFGSFNEYTADLNEDQKVDLLDFSGLALGWQDNYNLQQLSELTAQWLLE
ncbi:glycoside hydrolase family 16 protein [Sedimentisphaera salicampi]|uniref:Kappa-carrageenase n=1 Tax=Sedimentisphaera salicampi TaxID=1941349 RepID=A0A1W6LJH0_9BACT|nr:glycoside hydrolase family 16 protein [Sedimentisphaera salicampi]ARN55938.1 Kappa-carrageenase precursor [Sedimentisphaera salicampi]OXU15854.1 Kappa-carrageenase precursor [Sedimentisphaera salicampi]